MGHSVNFQASDQVREVAQGAARYLSGYMPLKSRQQMTDKGVDNDAEHWRKLCEMGVSQALFPFEEGGCGGTGSDIGALFEVLGSALTLEPFLSTLVAGKILASARTHSLGLQGLADGSIRAGVAYEESGSRYDPEGIESCAARKAFGWVLNGRKVSIPVGQSADFVIVSARCGTPDTPGVSLFLLPWVSVASGWVCHRAIDGSVVSTLSLEGVQVPQQALVGEAGHGLDYLRRGLMYGAFAVCAEIVGLLHTASQLTQDCLKANKQFGFAIVGGQLSQSRCADILIEADGAHPAVRSAAKALDRSDPSAERMVSAAKASIAAIVANVARECIDVSDEIRSIPELPLTQIVHRLAVVEHLFGDADFHLRRYVELGGR